MVLNTLTVGAAVTPAVIQTYISHYTNRKPLRQKPTAHISYHEGLKLIRQFLHYASHHTVEELQAFTAQWVPSPTWVKVDRVSIPPEALTKAAELLIAQLGEKGVNKIGGKQWWQWRLKNQDLEAEWIEMRVDHHARQKNELNGRRVMLYVHGGAYFFGSTDEHRYQMQRHARKLRARVLAPRYRLAPQFPFPCGLQDCLATYLQLLTLQDPTDIILAGDSAGGGMVLSMLVILRDQGLPLPAGAILLSPWVDLTHSFPSLGGSGEFDYIPAHGFMQRPSPAWPPPNDDEMEAIAKGAISGKATSSLPRSSTAQERKKEEAEAVQGFTIRKATSNDGGENADNANQGTDRPGLQESVLPAPGHLLSIKLDGHVVELKDQIQLYTTNQLISHPLVSPVLQPSLGGLPPLLIMVGGGELLRDEQIYLAHKAANPTKYPPGEAYLDEYDPDRTLLTKYKPTDVQLQVWDDLCHVAPTLSFTRPAKYMYRSVAQFGAWALARAQNTAIEILDDDQVSIISTGNSVASEDAEDQPKGMPVSKVVSGESEVGKAGDPLPRFKDHMIRQRVDRHGVIYDLAPASRLESLQMSPSEIGTIKKGPVEKWMKAKKRWDGKYSSEKRRVQKQRIRDMLEGFETFGGGEVPPPSALAGRRKRGDIEPIQKKHKSLGLMMWSLWGSSHDQDTMKREKKLHNQDHLPDRTTTTGANGGTETTTTSRDRAISGGARLEPPKIILDDSKSRSRTRTVTDAGQTGSTDLDSSAGNYASLTDTSRPWSSSTMDHSSPLTPTTPVPMDKRLSSLRAPSAANMETASIVSAAPSSAYAASDTASTKAVFAAPGVLSKPLVPRHTRNTTISTVGSGTSNLTAGLADGESAGPEPETSRRGSLKSVERLRMHQAEPLSTDESGEASPNRNTADVTHGLAESEADESALSSGRIGLGERSLSSGAVRGVEGVLKSPLEENHPSADASEAPHVNGEARPSMPYRDEYVTAQEA